MHKYDEFVCAKHTLPEKGMVLDANFPQPLRGAMIGQLEANGAFKLFMLSSANKWYWRGA